LETRISELLWRLSETTLTGLTTEERHWLLLLSSPSPVFRTTSGGGQPNVNDEQTDICVLPHCHTAHLLEYGRQLAQARREIVALKYSL
jgi:hypothetical protein